MDQKTWEDRYLIPPDIRALIPRGQMIQAVNPHPLGHSDPRAIQASSSRNEFQFKDNIPTWTRCSIWQDQTSVRPTTFLSADIVGTIGTHRYVLSIVNQGLEDDPIPGTYKVDNWYHVQVEIDLSEPGAPPTARWGGGRWALPDGAATFAANKRSGSLDVSFNAGSLDHDHYLRLHVHGDWRCE